MKSILFLGIWIAISHCTHTMTGIPVSHESVEAGSQVSVGGKSVDLATEGGRIEVGKPIGPFLAEFSEASGIKGRVAVINVVPSIDTPVCEAQTHVLGEAKSLNPKVSRVTISRDLPMAQKRFAAASGLENVTYFSDYKHGSFGKSAGLLMRGNELLARAVIVTDEEGIVRYLQIVPNVAHMPDMEKSFSVANELAGSH